jgi:hypothetical protein
MLTYEKPFSELEVLVPSHLKLSKTSHEFVTKLLNIKDTECLLCSERIKNDSFFKDIDWIKLENGILDPPIDPKVYIILFIYTVILSKKFEWIIVYNLINIP